MTEHTYASESDAHDARRQYINAGRAVSLVAYDPARDAYVFDVEQPVTTGGES